MNVEEQRQFLLEQGISRKARFYRLAQLARIDSKESNETWQAYLKFDSLLYGPDLHIAEIGAGHGLLGVWLAWLGKGYVTLYDRRYVDAPPKTFVIASKFKPHITDWLRCEGTTLVKGAVLPHQTNVLLGVHTCGDLVDWTLTYAATHRCKVAVMPCCYNKRTTNVVLENLKLDTGGWGLPTNVGADLKRAAWLSAQSFSVRLRSIAAHITPMNRIICGVPLENN